MKRHYKIIILVIIVIVIIGLVFVPIKSYSYSRVACGEDNITERYSVVQGESELFNKRVAELESEFNEEKSSNIVTDACLAIGLPATEYKINLFLF